MTGIKRNLLGAALLGMIAAACWTYAIFTTGGLERQYAGISVRLLETPVSRRTLEKALEQPNDGELTCAAAWTRSDGKQPATSKLGGETGLRVVRVYGDMRQTEPLKLICGTFPAEDDADGCLLDKASAWALFHSTDAVGAAVTVDGRDYIVRGIAETYEPALLIRDDRASYENLEFSIKNLDGAKQSAGTFLYRCGTAGDFIIVQSGLVARVIRGAAWLPLWIAAVCAAITLVRRGWKTRGRAARCAFYWAAAFAISALLCWGVSSTMYWPQSFLPTKWSDFAFWGRLIDAWQTEEKARALMTQLPKEIVLFSLARRCAAALILSIFSGGWCASAARRIPRHAGNGKATRAEQNRNSLHLD